LLFVATQAVSFWQLSRAEKALDAQIAEIFAQALPGQPVVDVRAQMQGALASRGAAGGGLLPVVSVLAQAIAQAPSTRIEAMSFRGNALELRLTAPTVESLDGIKQAMSRDGITVELQSATPRDGVVEGRFQVRVGQA
jgi:type II secretion system protein L